ncbi:MAG: hypothetical protein PHX33_06200 [Candidatus Cloacimonetes bacterium]|nr:hypothetical protein [Candidatus Cloacimonadota bacterium]
MKTQSVFFYVSIAMSVLLIFSCSKQKAENEMQNVRVLAHDLLAEFNQIDSTMAESIAAAEGNFGTEAEIRTLLSAGLGAHPAVITSCYVDGKGILKYLEPEKYRESEGADISTQEHTIAMLQNPEPLISTAFRAVEGFAAIVLAQPLFDVNNAFVGSLVLTLDTSLLPQMVLDKSEMSKDYELWAMEPSGMMICNQDQEEIALNLFTDPLYESHESLRLFAAKVSSLKSGEGDYSFMATGSSDVLKKTATWDTITLHGREWRVVLAKVQK